MTGLLLTSDRPVTDRGERVDAQPKAPRRSRLARLLVAWPYLVPLLGQARCAAPPASAAPGIRAEREEQDHLPGRKAYSTPEGQ
jgi:hypothetical protein